MQYNEKYARELQKQYNLKEATVTTWRSRGKIPDKFARYQSEFVSKSMSDKMLKILSSDKFHQKNLTSIENHFLQDVKRGKVFFRKTDLARLRVELKQLSNKLKRFLNAPTIHTLQPIVLSPILHPNVIFNRRVVENVKKGFKVKESDMEEAIKAVIIFLNEISL